MQKRHNIRHHGLKYVTIHMGWGLMNSCLAVMNNEHVHVIFAWTWTWTMNIVFPIFFPWTSMNMFMGHLSSHEQIHEQVFCEISYHEQAVFKISRHEQAFFEYIVHEHALFRTFMPWTCRYPRFFQFCLFKNLIFGNSIVGFLRIARFRLMKIENFRFLSILSDFSLPPPRRYDILWSSGVSFS